MRQLERKRSHILWPRWKLRTNPTKVAVDSQMITSTDGSQIEYHTSFTFPRLLFLKMKQGDKDTLRREREAYYETQRNHAEIQELYRQIQDNGSTGLSTSTTLPTDVSVSQRLQVIQLYTDTFIMGVRNEKANARQDRRAGAFFTHRLV